MFYLQLVLEDCIDCEATSRTYAISNITSTSSLSYLGTRFYEYSVHFLGQQSGSEAAGSLIDSLLVISTLFSWKVSLSGKNFLSERKK